QSSSWCASLTSAPGLDYAVAQHKVAIQLAHVHQDALWESYAHLDLGKTFDASHNEIAAEQELKEAIRVNPADSFAVYELAQHYLRTCLAEAKAASAALEHGDLTTCAGLADALQISRGLC